MHAHEELFRKSLLPFDKAAENEHVEAARQVHFRVVAGRKDRLDGIDLHDLEMLIDGKQQTVVGLQRVVARHTL